MSQRQGWGQGEETSEKTSETLKKPQLGPSREILLELEFSMAYQRTILGVLESSWGRVEWPLTPGPLAFPCGSAGKESSCNEGDLDSIPGFWGYSGEGKGYPLQYSGLENSMDCIVHGVAKSQTPD